jgi:hypothetical protein
MPPNRRVGKMTRGPGTDTPRGDGHQRLLTWCRFAKDLLNCEAGSPVAHPGLPREHPVLRVVSVRL